MMGRYIEQLQNCPAGNIVGLVGVDQYLLKCGTITTHPDAHNFVTMKYSVSPVVRVAVDVTNASDLPKLMEGLKRLQKSDPLVQCTTAPTGEHIIAGAGELHLEICLKDLREDFMKGAQIKIGNPIVSFCETIRENTEMQCLSKSPNKHNRIYMTAQPLSEAFVKGVDSGEINPDEDSKILSRKLADSYGWDITDARKLWTFGLLDGKANVLVDTTKAVQYLHEIKDSCVGAFLQASTCGVYCEEAMRGITEMQCLSKSPNKHNRIYMTAQPLSEAFVRGVDSGEINPDQDTKILSRKLADNFGWDITDARKLWTFGLLDGKANV